jgi:hypothetical protein
MEYEKGMASSTKFIHPQHPTATPLLQALLLVCTLGKRSRMLNRAPGNQLRRALSPLYLIILSKNEDNLYFG